MSAFAKQTFKASSYANFRPSYPTSLYNYIHKYHQTQQYSNALDIGCGPGQASYALLDGFDNVTGIDASQPMIEQAQSRIPKTLKDRIKFEISSAKDLSWLDSQSFDLVTCAQSIHWFGSTSSEFEMFFQEIRRILKPNGTFAYWGYNDPIFIDGASAVDLKNANYLASQFTYEDKGKLGPYWEQPGRDLLRSNMNGIYPKVGFSDLERVVHYPGKNPQEEGRNDIALNESPLIIRKKVKLIDYFNYIQTWSSYSSWKLDHPDEEDISKIYLKELKSLTGWKDDTLVEYEFITFLTICRKSDQ